MSSVFGIGTAEFASRFEMNREALDPHMSNWNAMAELDPLWAILSDPEKKFGKWSAEEFFRDGDREARRVVGMCDANGVSVLYGKMLDFGCEVGRMRRAFSQFFSTSVGIDVSGKMVESCEEIQRRPTAV